MANSLNIPKAWQRVALYVTIIGSITGSFTLAGGIDWLHREFGTHEEMDARDARIEQLEQQIEDLTKGAEFFFHFGRNMTDDPDKTIYNVETGAATNEEIYEVDVRQNNENVQFGFVFGKWWIMEIKRDNADSTKMLLDWTDDKYKRLKPE